ncbi:MAG TPA: CocE/NonD family hydrolase [Vicinamibacterales bacterium]|jgi:putative CocE/NonD family hydrolase|nr:CocE/NonD family hydrolase [Vicinamibacterales bacterium]
MLLRHLRVVLVVSLEFTLLFGALHAAQGGADQGGAGVAVMRDVMVAMRDGVRLATDIYLPTRDGTVIADHLPAILERTPYNKNGSEREGRYFAERGYAFVSEDIRGRYRSEGVWRMTTDDGRDGADLCEWIGRQPWSNGSIGTMGTSYVGGTQHAIALEKAPNLKTAIPVDAMSNYGYQSMRNGGAFELRWFNWIVAMAAPQGSHEARDPATAAALAEMAENKRAYLLQLPIRKGTTPLQLAPEYEDWLVSALGHGTNDDFYSQNNIVDHTDRYKDIPVYLVGGWYDSWAGNTSRNYQALSRSIKGPVYLIMGPWIHGQQDASAHGQTNFGRDAAIADPLAWRLEWFDHWLKGAANSVGRSAPFVTPVRVFVMGGGDERKGEGGRHNHGGAWRDEREWPLARTRYTNYYFQQGGGLSPAPPDAAAASTTYAFDPKDPVPTIGGNISSSDGIMLQGAWDQRGGAHVWNGQTPIPLSARKDVLVFQTAPLETDVEVTGEIEVKLWASSSALDTDFTAKLLDVHPPNRDYPAGFDQNLEDGIVRARFRDSLTQEKLMQPGTVYEFTIRLYPTSNLFKAGHRIRVDLSSSNFPRFDINPNTGEKLNDSRRTIVATNAVLHDRTHPSHIVLPIIPAGTQTTAGR